jgi:uncharacterized membrane protein
MIDTTPDRTRYALVDLARGAAIVAMVIYHLAWDLSYYRLIETDVSTHSVWVAFARGVLSSFLLLAGFGLVLGHGEGIRWRAFWRREAIVIGAAALVSLGTWLAFGPALAWFGVLHAIALASLIALPFLRVHWGVTLLVAAIFIVPPRLVRFDAFNDMWLSWIGFWTFAPQSADLVPVFPWTGVLLLGVAGGVVFLQSSLKEKAATVTLKGAAMRTLARAGRWSLLIYLLHQPLLHAVLYPLAAFVVPQTVFAEGDFVAACESSCELGGGEAGFCTRYCACALDQIETGEVGDFLNQPPETLEDSADVAQMAALCSALAGVQPAE